MEEWKSVMKETIEISDNYPIVLNQNDKACQDPFQLLVSYQNNISFRINKCFNMNDINMIHFKFMFKNLKEIEYQFNSLCNTIYQQLSNRISDLIIGWMIQ